MEETRVLSPIHNEVQNIDHLQQKYFESSNVLCRHIISEQKGLMKYLGDTWKDLDGKRRDALLDLLFVDEVRERYSASTTENGGRRGSTDNIPESFPTLYIDSGQKIHVDYENDLWTWRDEHSGPFSWMSRSQQDLTLADLDEENISKPQPKTAKGDTEGNKTNKIAEEQFTYPVNSWSRDIIDGFRKHEKEIIITPSSSEYFHVEEKSQTEQLDAPVSEEISRTSRAARCEAETSPQDFKTDVRERRKRSPSPKKIIRSSSLKRSPSKASDQGEQKLITNKNEEAYEERNTFSNPVMETEWSNFLGNETDTDAPINPMAGLLSPNEPVIQIIDRGRDALGSSPYQGDRIQLISTTDSTSQASGISAHLGSPGLSSWSAESTPDHSTHLLKGMQSEDKPTAVYPADSQEVHQTDPLDFEVEEVLTVQSDGENVKIVTEPETKTENGSPMPTTGFDFLDNW